MRGRPRFGYIKGVGPRTGRTLAALLLALAATAFGGARSVAALTSHLPGLGGCSPARRTRRRWPWWASRRGGTRWRGEPRRQLHVADVSRWSDSQIPVGRRALRLTRTRVITSREHRVRSLPVTERYHRNALDRRSRPEHSRATMHCCIWCTGGCTARRVGQPVSLQGPLAGW